MRILVLSLLIGFYSVQATAEVHPKKNFSFEFNSVSYEGFLFVPKGRVKGMVVIIPGHGKTAFHKENKYWDALFSTFNKSGLTVCVWNKAGCGNSEGTYNHNQSVYNNAQEAMAAIKKVRNNNIEGSNKIGLWGASRGGWICPLIIDQDPSIAFWISVSGTDAYESSDFMYKTHLEIEGIKDVELLTMERKAGRKLLFNGAPFEEYIQAVKHIKNDALFNKMLGGVYSKESYEKTQIQIDSMGLDFKFDNENGKIIFVDDFEKILDRIACPTLAIFGEKDSQVDWKSALTLYKKTLGKKEGSILTIKTFPNGNHSILKCETGSIYEDLNKYGKEVCDGYYQTISSWILKLE